MKDTPSVTVLRISLSDTSLQTSLDAGLDNCGALRGSRPYLCSARLEERAAEVIHARGSGVASRSVGSIFGVKNNGGNWEGRTLAEGISPIPVNDGNSLQAPGYPWQGKRASRV